MKKAILIFTMVLGLTTVSLVYAQLNRYPENNENRANKMTKYLDLDENQVSQMKTLFEGFRAELIEVEDNERMSTEEKFKKLFLIRKHHQDKIDDILNEKQKEKLVALRENDCRESGMPSFKHRYHKNGLHSKLKEKRIEFDMELSDEEKSIIAEFRVKFKEIRDEKIRESKNGDFRHYRFHDNDHKENEIAPLMEIAANHRESIVALMEDVRDEMHRQGGNNIERRKDSHRNGKKRLRAIHFLLLDTTKDSMDSDKQNELATINLFPNPVSTTLNVQFELVDDAMVSIEILNKNGHLLETIESANIIQGSHTLQYNVSYLAPGEIYFVKVSRPDKVMVEKFIKL